ncbi:protein kinase [Fadolivirus algeromassiliense]|jgi:hypothetical protein|uniref:Protein kinase n=1 Tax=Fadolivirus FV1/VV64 TaxID=3070911 RepID=A0A7D3UUJ3_9VIRU|nr:protein kinase [Fadolivirus algeromassiliense]QKF93529.1 protein kinase [Fadolivirus FV1/VV64]
MKTVYTNNNINQLECQNILNINSKNITSNRKNMVVVPYSKTKTCFVKTIDRSRESNPKKELDPTLKVINYLKHNTHYNPLFVKINVIKQIDNNDYYLMEYIKFGDLNTLLPILNRRWKYSLLIQSLMSIYILNHKIKLFHNDLYYMDVIRNIMVDQINETNTIKLEILDHDIAIDISKFCIKMIDFGRCSSKQEFRTTEYHKKYFPDMKHVSELFLFTFIYLKSLGDQSIIDFNEIQNNMAMTTNTLKEFDDNFLLFMCNKFMHKTNKNLK